MLEVKTGFFGLGRHLYIPLSAVQEILAGCVYLAQPKEAFEELGWYTKPAFVDQPH